jgi:CheY-like chemotaxis protein
MEANFLQAQKMAVTGQLAAGVAHDFNNLLGAVLMHLGLLQGNPAIDPSTLALLGELEKEARRGAVLTRRLLAFGRQQPVEPAPVDLDQILADVAAMLRRLLGEHIDLAWESSSEQPLIEADRGLVEQLIVNLCVYARDALPKGGSLHVGTALIDAPANLGIGMDRQVRLRATVRASDAAGGSRRVAFRPGAADSAPGAGADLSWAAVAGIVKELGGRSSVERGAAGESTLQILLPSCGRPALPADAEETCPAGASRELILLVEDQASLRSAVGANLRRSGYRVMEAANGPEALELVRSHGGRIDLLLTDQVMPAGLTGADLAKLLREKNPDLRVILHTGYGARAVAEAGAAGPWMTRLLKPADSGELLRAVRKSLSAA